MGFDRERTAYIGLDDHAATRWPMTLQVVSARWPILDRGDSLETGPANHPIRDD